MRRCRSHEIQSGSPRSVDAAELVDDDYPHGLLVVTPEQYSELSLLGGKALSLGVEDLLWGKWGADSATGATQRVAETAVALYTLAPRERALKISTSPHRGVEPMLIRLGSLELVFDFATVNRLLDEPPIRRDLLVAKALNDLDASVGRSFLAAPVAALAVTTPATT